MKPYRNAALIVGSLIILGIASAGEGFSPEHVLFLVAATLGVLAVLALTAKARSEGNR
ncbi:MAG: hypothetical protein KDB26_10910 [Microthrixaceae bacterium]|nr:hypothetical protein [Microthrixaceae bacterium]